MADAVQQAINDSRRVPNMVLTGHVHNYQRIERAIAGATPTPFIVAGAGGYYHLHGMTAPNGHVDPDLGAKLIAQDDMHHSYVTLSVDQNNVSGVMTPIAATGSAKNKQNAKIDTFSYSAKKITLNKGVTVSL